MARFNIFLTGLGCVVEQNGALVLVVSYGGDMKSDKFKVEPAERLDDNQWHDVYFTRRDKQVRVMPTSH